jgi:hypothetical protein
MGLWKWFSNLPLLRGIISYTQSLPFIFQVCIIAGIVLVALDVAFVVLAMLPPVATVIALSVLMLGFCALVIAVVVKALQEEREGGQ